MFELVILLAGCIAMARIAEIENESAVVWTGVTIALCVAAMFLIPWPIARISIAVVAAFLAMTAYKIVRQP